MRADLHRTLEKIGENLPRGRRITLGILEKAYAQTLRLRSQLLGAMYDRIDFGSAPQRTIRAVSVSQPDFEVGLPYNPGTAAGSEGTDQNGGRALGLYDPRCHRSAG